MVTAYQGTVQNGEIRFDDEPELPEGSQVIVVVVGEASQKKPRNLTARELAESELVGLWANRDDISDRAAYARKLREQAQRRDNAPS